MIMTLKSTDFNKFGQVTLCYGQLDFLDLLVRGQLRKFSISTSLRLACVLTCCRQSIKRFIYMMKNIILKL